VISVALITIALLAIGGILWSMDDDSQIIEDGGSNSEWFRGAKDAAITIDVYPDFDCSVGVEKECLVLEALDIYPDDVLMVYHHYPTSEFGQVIAEALEAAGEQGKFWEMHDRLSDGVPDDVTALKALAAEIGLDMQAFNEALDSGKFQEKVELAKEEAISRGVESVSVFINGREYQHYPGTLSDLRAAIEEELNRIGDDDTD